jgi:hypothetical protein
VLLIIGYRAKLQGLLPEHPYKPRMWKVLYPVAIGWSILFCVVLIYQNPRQVGLGTLGAVVIGLILYYVLVPKDDSVLAVQEHSMSASPSRDPIA